MTLKEILAMFEPGQTWIAQNTKVPTACGRRVLLEKKSENIVWRQPESPKPEQRLWMPIPKARHIIEARPGYLSFMLGGAPDWVVTLTLEGA